MYASDEISRQHFLDKNISRIRVKILKCEMVSSITNQPFSIFIFFFFFGGGGGVVGVGGE